jgi:hypothetical protein
MNCSLLDTAARSCAELDKNKLPAENFIAADLVLYLERLTSSGAMCAGSNPAEGAVEIGLD